MTNHISEVIISGLWGRDVPIHIPLGRHFNFIIGRNGTGKTTVINLIAAVLMADFEKLDKIIFSKILIKLRPMRGRARPSIEVVKMPKSDLPYSDISFRVKLTSDHIIEFDLDAFAEERAYRGAPTRFMRERAYRDKFLFVQRQLQEIVNVTWLSVYRGTEEREREERRYQSAVDQKLASLNIELVKYFTKLATNFDEKTKEFQRTSFLALTQVEKMTNIRAFMRNIDIEHERAALASIFKLLGVERQHYESKLSSTLQGFAKAKDKFLDDSGMTLEEFFLIFNAYRTHSLVESYENLQRQSADIFGPRQVFLEVVNGLLNPRKQAALSATNELLITAGSNSKAILLDELSSGEKQLLIILGQALLQEGQTAIYIADEPELSLHVEWQEQITSAIERLNPNAQIIFATHSPDIVGRHSDCIIDMEQVSV